SFTPAGKTLKAQLEAACDDQLTVFLNGKEIGSSAAWKEPLKRDILKDLKPGENVLAVRAKNDSGVAGLVVVLTLEQESGKREVIMTDRMWLSSADAPAGW